MATDTYRVTVHSSATPTNTVVVPAAETTEFERFESLAAKLVKVPKGKIAKKSRS